MVAEPEKSQLGSQMTPATQILETANYGDTIFECFSAVFGCIDVVEPVGVLHSRSGLRKLATQKPQRACPWAMQLDETRSQTLNITFHVLLGPGLCTHSPHSALEPYSPRGFCTCKARSPGHQQLCQLMGTRTRSRRLHIIKHHNGCILRPAERDLAQY